MSIFDDENSALSLSERAELDRLQMITKIQAAQLANTQHKAKELEQLVIRYVHNRTTGNMWKLCDYLKINPHE